MLEFTEDIIDCVHKLRERYVNRKNCVIVSYPIIEILKYSNLREISTKLFYIPENHTLELQASDQKCFSKISYFDYNRDERRWIRCKDHLTSLIRDLQFCGLWDYVCNKDLIVVNTHNSKISTEKRSKILSQIVDSPL